MICHSQLCLENNIRLLSVKYDTLYEVMTDGNLIARRSQGFRLCSQMTGTKVLTVVITSTNMLSEIYSLTIIIRADTVLNKYCFQCI